MEIFQNILILLSIFITLIILDYIWLGIVTKNFIISQFGSLITIKNDSINIKLLYGLLAWLIIALGCLIFVVLPNSTLGKVALMGAIFGFVLYATYDLTNLTFLNNYPTKFAFVDIIWGTIVCSLISVSGYFVKTIL